jgi:hypothetical protein
MKSIDGVPIDRTAARVVSRGTHIAEFFGVDSMLCDIDTATLSRECVIIQTSGVVLDTPLAKRGIDTLLSASNPAQVFHIGK